MKNILNEELGRMQYLFGYKKGIVISEQTEIKQGSKGDPYQYKKDGDKYYYAKKTEGTNANWIEQKNQKGIDAIKTKIFNNSSTTPTKTTTTDTATTPIEKVTATGINVQSVYDQLAKGQDKMNNQTFNTFAYLVKVIPGADKRAPSTGKVDGVASMLKLDDFKSKFPNYSSYRYVPTPEGGFKPGMDVESGAVYGKEPIIKDTQISAEDQMNRTKKDNEEKENLENENMIQEWCDSNEILVDEECYPVEGMDYNQARRQSSIDARADKHPYKRDEYWNEENMIYIAIYGFKSRNRKELKQREAQKNEKETPSENPNPSNLPKQDFDSGEYIA